MVAARAEGSKATSRAFYLILSYHNKEIILLYLILSYHNKEAIFIYVIFSYQNKETRLLFIIDLGFRFGATVFAKVDKL